jgi:hypothetical protein
MLSLKSTTRDSVVRKTCVILVAAAVIYLISVRGSKPHVDDTNDDLSRKDTKHMDAVQRELHEIRLEMRELERALALERTSVVDRIVDKFMWLILIIFGALHVVHFFLLAAGQNAISRLRRSLPLLIRIKMTSVGLSIIIMLHYVYDLHFGLSLPFAVAIQTATLFYLLGVFVMFESSRRSRDFDPQLLLSFYVPMQALIMVSFRSALQQYWSVPTTSITWLMLMIQCFCGYMSIEYNKTSSPLRFLFPLTLFFLSSTSEIAVSLSVFLFILL